MFMQQQHEPPQPLDYSIVRPRRTSRFDVGVFVVVTVLVAPFHFGAFMGSTLLNYSCCSSHPSAAADIAVSVLAFPMPQWTTMLTGNGDVGLAGIMMNSLIWGAAAGAVFALRGSRAAPAPPAWPRGPYVPPL
jgi:hypothetical protein